MEEGDRISALEAHREHDVKELDSLKAELKAFREELRIWRESITKGKAFWTGVAAVVVPLWAVAVSLVSYLWDRIFQGGSIR